MVQINVHEAKTHLSRLLVEVVGGKEVIIARGGKPIARLVALANVEQHRIPGLDAGRILIADDFDAELSEEITRRFER
jgi:prevent-host-death family protein